jgi:hypothetical protein
VISLTSKLTGVWIALGVLAMGALVKSQDVCTVSSCNNSAASELLPFYTALEGSFSCQCTNTQKCHLGPNNPVSCPAYWKYWYQNGCLPGYPGSCCKTITLNAEELYGTCVCKNTAPSGQPHWECVCIPGTPTGGTILYEAFDTGACLGTGT